MRKFIQNAALLAASALCLVSPAMASGYPTVSVPETEILLEPSGGRYSFTIEIDSQTPYAGAEFGVFCSQGTEITSVTVSGGSVTGPQAADGLIWFGFFEGSDSFTGTATVTIEGQCQAGADGAIAIQDVKLYTIGAQEYTSTAIDCGTVVNLLWELPPETQPEEPQASAPAEKDIGVPVLLGCCTVIAAAGAGMLIYKSQNQKKNKKEKEHASEEMEP